ncbi:hypothetical protein HNP55_003952 [Paucibacter oligotrophus]|uniref:DUF3649 domain-containing protein n=1 Tax=Roseateles oligotrophus TaxID=1769250 RepID=A0A840LFJ1_9BURK|nr:hypothetical protein [Roseateles oligotrophus]MBB4845402.1 hypothetical protein [Roseateles oligotrophus]
MPPITSAPRPAGSVIAALSWRYRLAVFSRAAAALLGGYLLAAAVAAATAVYLPVLAPITRNEATVGGTMLAYLLYAIAFMAAFACLSAWRAWMYTLGPALLLAALVWLPRWL